ncbi:MAG: VOC family protein [Methanoregula sp.]
MANIAYFEIPADNVDRAKHFYHTLLGWKIEPTKAPLDPAKAAATQYQDITTGAAQEGTMNMGGMYKRQMTETIKNYVVVEDIDKVLAKVGKLGGKIVMPKEDIKGVGEVAIIQDTEGNGIGLWKPGMK